jgi:Clp amino terminal domain, pathogenicity island component
MSTTSRAATAADSTPRYAEGSQHDHDLLARLTSGVHPSYLQEERSLGPLFPTRASTEASEVFHRHAQAAAKSLDDNHVGIEHITLALFRFGPNAARTALEQTGITKDHFLAVLDQEPGPSPMGPSPTPRALIIAGLAVSESDRLGADRFRSNTSFWA